MEERLFVDILLDSKIKKNFKILCIEQGLKIKHKIREMIELEVLNHFS